MPKPLSIASTGLPVQPLNCDSLLLLLLLLLLLPLPLPLLLLLLFTKDLAEFTCRPLCHQPAPNCASKCADSPTDLRCLLYRTVTSHKLR